MKFVLIGLFVFSLFLGVFLQRPPDPSGRRGDVVSFGDIDDQTIFNVDNTGGGGSGGGGGKGGGGGGKGGGGGGKGGGGGGGGLDCKTIIQECQCYNPQPQPQPTIPPGPRPTQVQMEYDMYGDRYGG